MLSFLFWCTQNVSNVVRIVQPYRAMMHNIFFSLARNLMYVHCLHNDNEKCHKSIGTRGRDAIWYRSALHSCRWVSFQRICSASIEMRWVFMSFAEITSTHSRIFPLSQQKFIVDCLNCFSIKSRREKLISFSTRALPLTLACKG